MGVNDYSLNLKANILIQKLDDAKKKLAEKQNELKLMAKIDMSSIPSEIQKRMKEIKDSVDKDVAISFKRYYDSKGIERATRAIITFKDKSRKTKQ